MTLATVPRYAADRVGRLGERAVVLGGGLAGLCAARVLLDAFDVVTVMERDPVPSTPTPRRGVPQSRHVHVLLEAGRATLGDLFGGFGERLLAAGGVEFDVSYDFDFYIDGGFVADGPTRRSAYSATRPLFEGTVRALLLGHERVEFRPETQFVDFRADGADCAVHGAEVRPADGDEAVIGADLVVDATGRTSRTPAWLESNGYRTPPLEEVEIDVAYSSTFVDRPPATRRGVAVLPTPANPRGGVAMPVEDDRWIMTLWGMHGANPPADAAGFVDYTEQLPIQDLRRLLDDHEWRRDDIDRYPFASTRRYRYEALDRFPDGLVVTGDAIASFNPIYGQGMSVGALEAVALHHALAEGGLDDLAPRFFARVGEIVDDAWTLAVTNDHQFAETTGPRPTGTRPMTWYLSRLLRRAHDDGALAEAFFEVQMMERRPTALLRPGVLWRVLAPGR